MCKAEPNTLEELAALPGYSVGTRIAAKFLGTSQWGLTCAAKEGMLGLPYAFSGNRLHISKAALLEYLGYKQGEKKLCLYKDVPEKEHCYEPAVD